ncbi:hypothetical protein ACWEQA_11070 [Nocardia sp. NPDC004085]|uniref:hypothetical protein n=1 Tax=Nocardia sp. NPDC019255 TaxID=3154591 RepID=UPI0033F7E3B2
MDIGTLLSTFVTVFAACGAALLGVGCVWPSDLPRRRTPRRNSAGRQTHSRTLQWPEAWTCATPTQPLTVATAHHAMQLHREHDCPRKRAAFAALVAAGRITPDSTRRNRRWSDPS